MENQMGDSSESSGRMNDSGVVELAGKIMMAVIIVLFLVVVFVFFLHIYAKLYWYRREEDGTTTRRRRRLDGNRELSVVTRLRHGLDPSVLKSIPVVLFSSKDFKEELECAVCISEVSDGENTRFLPTCNHGFHVDCIDMWFESHSTCPLCRNPVSIQSPKSPTPESTPENININMNIPEEENSAVNGYSNESPNLPTNVLFLGNETQVSTLNPSPEKGDQNPACSSSSSSSSNRPDGMLVIEIPRQINEEELKSPLPKRMNSFKRLLSLGRRVNPYSPRNVDIEQGIRDQS